MLESAAPDATDSHFRSGSGDVLMCGILGYLATDGSAVDEDLLRAMTDTMTHRGPDDAGTWVDGNIGLGHRRLSIIDLSADGRQPMCNEDGRVWIAFNGEIYNFRELRVELEGKGHTFRSHTDTEVIIHGYEQWGHSGCLQRLRGMFAFALWDGGRNRLVVARDRLGIKPLYYWRGSRALVVASELKAILRHPKAPRAADRTALLEHFAYRFTLPPRTAFAGISKLPAGHCLVASGDRMEIEEYWRPAAGDANERRSEDDCAAELGERLREVVEGHLVSDVPLGAFLSGGVDSSSLVALMSELVDQPVETYTAAFGGGWHDESSQARLVADALHTRHHELDCRADSSALLEKIIWHLEEPLINTSVIPLYFVAELASRDIKVVLAGEGADEVNGGYTKYSLIARLLQLRRWRRALPGLDATVGWLADRLPRSAGSDRIRRIDALSRAGGAGFLALSSTALGAEGASVFDRELADELAAIRYDAESTLLAGYDGVSDVRQRFFLYDIRGWLSNELLIRADKMTMAHSLEARVPFLDHELVEFCLTLPPDMKVGGGTTKRLLRRTMRPYLPDTTTSRQQHGFVVPLADWFRNDLREFVLDLSRDSRTRTRGYFDFARMDEIVNAHVAGDADWSAQIYGLVMTELWHRTFLDG